MFPRRPTVNKNLWPMAGVFAALLAVNLSLGGCISSGSQKPSRLQEKLEDARTKADHEELAGYYEQEANALQAKAKQHEQKAQAYGAPTGYARLENDLARHCNYLAGKYRDTAEANLALAKPHRRMAAESPYQEAISERCMPFDKIAFRHAVGYVFVGSMSIMRTLMNNERVTTRAARVIAGEPE